KRLPAKGIVDVEHHRSVFAWPLSKDQHPVPRPIERAREPLERNWRRPGDHGLAPRVCRSGKRERWMREHAVEDDESVMVRVIRDRIRPKDLGRNDRPRLCPAELGTAEI